MNSKAVFAIFMVYFGCGLNNVFLEYIIRIAPGSGHLITVAQFLFIAIHGFFLTSKCGTVKPVIPIQTYLILVCLFFITSVFNNWAFSFNIPVPLHMIFRSGSLIANMILGIIILKKRYTLWKFVSVGMITAGIIICTLISGQMTAHKTTCSDCGEENVVNEAQEDDDYFWWLIGIFILITALLLSARMGIYQEKLYKEYGKHPDEALYYTHMLSLPGFILYSASIWEHLQITNNSEMYTLPFVNFGLPILWIYLIGNVLTQYLCISSVYVLTTECTSLTVTLVITLRKFFSLIFSIVYFKNPFTLGHWIGTALVFLGTLIFTEVFSKLSISKSSISTKEKTS